jgi:hypothetical protein
LRRLRNHIAVGFAYIDFDDRIAGIAEGVLDEGRLVVAEWDEDSFLVERFRAVLEGEIVSSIDDILIKHVQIAVISYRCVDK